MKNLYIPFCSILLGLFLIILFSTKVKKYKNNENIYYLGMIIDAFLATIFCIISIYFIYIGDMNYLVVKFFNKLECCAIFNFSFNLFMYIYHCCGYKGVFSKIGYIINIIVFIIIFMLPSGLDINGDLSYMVVVGPMVVFTNGIVIVLILLTLFMAIKNYKVLQKKIIPVIAYLFFLIVIAYIRDVMPEFICMEFLMTFSTLIMYHTIENPDVKLINELELAKSNAERANNAKTEFLSNMSHEIRTPLNAIVGFSNAIIEEDNIEEIKSEAKDIIMASNNLLEIVNGILDISKIEAGKMEIVNVDYKPREVFNDLVKLIRPRIGEKPIELKSNFSLDIPYKLYGDMGKVREIITNLLTNAVKYTNKGVIDFSVSCINEKKSCKLVISVEDTGRGIKPEKIDKLFTKFNRLEEDKNTTLEGTGLGLAITKSLVEMMGGKIIVQSKYGSGSKFTVYLKQDIVSMVNDKKDNKDKEEVIVEDRKIDYSDKKVLIVDDNNLNIKVACRMLKNYNIIPDCVSSGMECIEKVKSNKYDLILLDDMMPKMSGVETLGKLKEDSSFDTPVVVLTANAISGMKEKYIKDGFCDYLAKPIDKLELVRVLDEYLGKK